MTTPARVSRTAPARLARRLPPREQGQVTAFVVIIMAAFLAFAGLVYDGGNALAAKTTAIDEAQEAARAGAQQINLAAFRATGQVTLDPAAAAAAARAYVAAAGGGDTATVTVTGDTVTVQVSAVSTTAFLRLFGIPAIGVTGSATATAETGVVAPAAGAGP
jgi:Putative Flp pilus-assembly TadE/G-like